MNNRTSLSNSFPLFYSFLLALVLPACGGSGGGADSETNNPPVEQNSTPYAVAGDDQDIVTGTLITLDGSASGDIDGDTLSYRWVQTHGPDVFIDADSLNTQASPSFTTPNEVGTLIFELVTNDGITDSAPDEVQINLLEGDISSSIFVDGDNGNDSDTGERHLPYKTIGHAITAAASGQDVYIMTRVDDLSYQESMATLSIQSGTSLYGGYGENWIRDANNNRSKLAGHSTAISYAAVNSPGWISGLDISAAVSSNASFNVMAILVEAGTNTLTIENNTLFSSDVRRGEVAAPGSSYGIVVKDIHNVKILGNDITTGIGGDAVSPVKSNNGNKGDNASGVTGGTNYTQGGNANGGRGQCHLSGYIENSGGLAGTKSLLLTDGGKAGDGVTATDQAQMGGAGIAAIGSGTFANALFRSLPGRKGSRGNHGCSGGAGGRGGDSGTAEFRLDGGNGGGGGAGGQGGEGGHGGASGGASIGIWLFHTSIASEIGNNIINMGSGGAGGLGSLGGDGGDGGIGAGYSKGECTLLGRCAGDGAKGGNGAQGGNGGQGGGGAGGPSYGIFIGPNLAPFISNNQIMPREDIIGGAGGNGAAGGNGGEGGWSYGIYDADSADGMVASLLQNTIILGQGGSGGDNPNNVGEKGATGQMGRKNW